MTQIDAIYARQSIDKADSISIESQIDFCKYETRGEPYRVFFDKGYSGKNTDRPQFQAMLQAIRKGEIKRVICYKLDRCSRSILDFSNLIEELQQHNVEFVSCTEKFDTSTPIGRAMLSICIVFAQLERETIQQRISDSYHARNKRGFYMGGPVPFGFTLEPCILNGKRTSRYQQQQEQAEILRIMYSIYSQPLHSLGDVVNALKDAGIRNPKREDGRWVRTHIGRILQNPIYVKADLEIYTFFREHGVVIHNEPQEFIGVNGCYLFSERGRTGTDGGLEGHHLVLAPHEGIVSSDLWLRCRRKHTSLASSKQPTKPKNTWLAGKLKCSQCGYALVTRKFARPSGKVYRYLMCSHAMEKGSRCAGVHGIHAEDIEEKVFVCLQQKCEAGIDLYISSKEAAHVPELSALRLKTEQLVREMEVCTQKAMEASGTMMKLLSEKATALEAERKICQKKMKKILEQPTQKEDSAIPIKALFSAWDTLNIGDRILITDLFIEKITLSESEMSIHWRI